MRTQALMRPRSIRMYGFSMKQLLMVRLLLLMTSWIGAIGLILPRRLHCKMPRQDGRFTVFVLYLAESSIVNRQLSIRFKPRGENLVIKAASIVDLAGGLKALLENGADPNGTGHGEKTALHHLGSPVQAGESRQQEQRLHETGIRLLIDPGASVVQRAIIGNTPLHYAAFGSNMRVFTLYADGLADQDQNTALAALENNNEETLLHWAAGSIYGTDEEAPSGSTDCGNPACPWC